MNPSIDFGKISAILVYQAVMWLIFRREHRKPTILAYARLNSPPPLVAWLCGFRSSAANLHIPAVAFQLSTVVSALAGGVLVIFFSSTRDYVPYLLLVWVSPIVLFFFTGLTYRLAHPPRG